MHRNLLNKLITWKKSKTRKPLIIEGARQVGKTWLLQEFGRMEYENTAYVNFDQSHPLADLFTLDYDIERIINGLEVYVEQKISPGTTLIILDEIQECPAALASLKYFYENAPDYHIAVAGSLLGITLHEGVSFPVGKVNTLHLYPLNFAEFVRATGKTKLADTLESGSIIDLQPFHSTLLDLLKKYLITGGMPEVVQNYLTEGNMLQTRAVQAQILSDYDHDFSKHAPVSQVPKIRELFHILPAELAKENKKFLFNMLKTGARAAEYENAILWLEGAGLATRVHRVSTIKRPLSFYYEKEAFKFYLLDVGLLGAMANLLPEVVLEKDRLFSEFNGAMAEQFVFQELVAAGQTPYYYRKDKPAREVDFLLDLGNEIIPIEVKAGTNTTSASLGAYLAENATKRAYKVSQREYRQHQTGCVDYLPLYLAGKIGKFS